MTDLRSTSHIEEELRADLTSIRRDWRRPDVDQGEVTRAMPGSTVLLTSAQMTRMAVQQDLGYWVRALMDTITWPTHPTPTSRAAAEARIRAHTTRATP